VFVLQARCLLVQAELHGAHDLIGLPVKVFSYRASTGAFYALVAKVDVLAQLFLNALGQIGIDP
jgi:hypothetical protein